MMESEIPLPPRRCSRCGSLEHTEDTCTFRCPQCQNGILLKCYGYDEEVGGPIDVPVGWECLTCGAWLELEEAIKLMES